MPQVPDLFGMVKEAGSIPVQSGTQNGGAVTLKNESAANLAFCVWAVCTDMP